MVPLSDQGGLKELSSSRGWNTVETAQETSEERTQPRQVSWPRAIQLMDKPMGPRNWAKLKHFYAQPQPSSCSQENTHKKPIHDQTCPSEQASRGRRRNHWWPRHFDPLRKGARPWKIFTPFLVLTREDQEQGRAIGVTEGAGCKALTMNFPSETLYLQRKLGS